MKLQVEFLGTGGAISTPRPECDCDVCAEARVKGVPYRRAGPSTFVHGPDSLLDTPEEIKDLLNRSRIRRIAGCFYSHWHPDHTLGHRVWEKNIDWRTWPWPRSNRATDIYLPQQVAADFNERLGLAQAFDYYKSLGLVRMHTIADGDSVRIGQTNITPLRLAEDYVYAFLFIAGGKRLLIAPDELFGWQPPEYVTGLDLAVIPMGILEFDPWSGERRIPSEHPVLQSEATFRQTLDIVRQLDARQTILSHIEEPDGMGFDELKQLGQKLRLDGFNIRFAHDTLLVDV